MDPEISHNIRQIQQATGSVVQISAFLVSALGTMTYNIGKKVAPHVIYQGQKVSELFVNPSRPTSGGKRERINLNFYFDTSLWCLKKFYEGL